MRRFKSVLWTCENYGGNKRKLVAYMVGHEGKEISTTQMRLFLTTITQIVPSAVVVLVLGFR